jgi:hypothetical protein
MPHPMLVIRFCPGSKSLAKPKSHSFTRGGREPSSNVLSSFRSLLNSSGTQPTFTFVRAVSGMRSLPERRMVSRAQMQVRLTIGLQTASSVL